MIQANEPQQKEGYGCGVYSVANSLLIPNFITQERVIESNTGNSVHQLNKWLEEDGIDWRVDVLYFDMENHKSENINGINWEKQEAKEPLIAMFQVKTEEKSRWHLVSAIIYTKEKVVITDSLKTKKIKCKFDTISDHYFQVSGMFLFRHKSKDEYAILLKN